jgi:4,5-DOPA dioxygenase extradiol
MFPLADVPVVQLSLDRSQGPSYHYQLGQQLKELREEGVLIVSSGNIVHNLRMMVFDENVKYNWAESFDNKVKQWILAGDHQPMIEYQKQGRDAELAINSAEHYLPLLYTLGIKDEGEPVSFFADKMSYAAISMRSIKVG